MAREGYFDGNSISFNKHSCFTLPGFRYGLHRMSFNRLSGLRWVLVTIKRAFFVNLLKMDIHPSVELSLSAKLDKTFPRGVHVGRDTYLAFESCILTHDRTRGLYVHTRIGKNCFVGSRSIILPGVTVSDNCVIGAGSVVTRDVPPRSIVAGNPAKVIRSDIEVGKYGRFLNADETERALRGQDPAVGALPSNKLGDG